MTETVTKVRKEYQTDSLDEFVTNASSELHAEITAAELHYSGSLDTSPVLKAELHPTLSSSMDRAKDQCVNVDMEERGGVIFEKEGNFEFVYFDNVHHGASIAKCLYQPDIDKFGEVMHTYLLGNWKFYGSFHTHPLFSEQFSSVDFQNLFQGFRVNYIYSVKNDILAKYTWSKNIKKLNKTIIVE